jgi:hypothetical protein
MYTGISHNLEGRVILSEVVLRECEAQPQSKDPLPARAGTVLARRFRHKGMDFIGFFSAHAPLIASLARSGSFDFKL